MANIVTVSGMFGNGKTYFADSPVVIDISGLQWPESSPFDVVRVEVFSGGDKVGEFKTDTGGQSSISFDISSALRNIWGGYNFSDELEAAQDSISSVAGQIASRDMREYYLHIYTEYMASDDGGVFTQTQCVDANGNYDIAGGRCLLGGLTEWERYLIVNKEDADVSHLEHTGVRNGDASTKPTSSPERVGVNSITSWVDVQPGLTKSIFYPHTATPEDDDTIGSQTGWGGHAPIVLRDSIQYADFLFVNRRGAVETCSGCTLESLTREVDRQQYSLVERPSFHPSRTIMSVATGGRKSFAMSSGYQTRDWADWWISEFMMARRHWMLYEGLYVPVSISPSKKELLIYDRSKQQIPHVDFTVTLGLEG